MDTVKIFEETIIDYLSRELGAVLIIIFGSAAQGKARPDSDIDIAFLSKHENSGIDLYAASQKLAGLLKRDVDLIDLNRVSPVLQVQVLKNGRIILDQDPHLRQEFFILALKKYSRLNEERVIIIDKIKERGQVYGR
jgi:predicted nucleotidyltransferase